MPNLTYILDWLWSYLLPFLAPSIAVYFYFKTRDSRIDSAKRETVRTLLHQIGAEGKLTLFQIQSVCNAKLREKKVGKKNIPPSIIVEDLVSEVLSNPLIENDKKSDYIENLESIGNLTITNFISNESEGFDTESDDFDSDDLMDSYKEYKISSSRNFMFVFVSICVIVYILILLFKNLLGNTFYESIDIGQISVVLGVITTIIAMLITIYRKR